ncbi:uncharacterized protein A4U43_C04F20480 [Asparagus officinalis]|uniref:Glyoxalase At5g48480-like C-terminal domain-containing protein n=1 Tax=Asparagus officinalis TaxID=4686 RepID=A0A5P1F7A8_ASPOF|nr:uncharacterized protein A4U43_C04F20480 [Asparagus officinalis]
MFESYFTFLMQLIWLSALEAWSSAWRPTTWRSAGAAITSEIAEDEDGCCGGVVGKVKDPFGVVWIISSLGKKRCAEPEPAA